MRMCCRERCFIMKVVDIQVFIVNVEYMNQKHTEPTIGGIQSYITSICRMLKEIDVHTVVYQMSLNGDEFKTKYNGIEIIGISCSRTNLKKRIREIIPMNNILIFGSEEVVTSYRGVSICLQHGIDWDRPSHFNRSRINNYLTTFRRSIMAFNKIINISKANKVVCVDYNFINWYRSQVSYPDIELISIPNFTSIPADCIKSEDIVRIIFARRFEIFRGTRIFANALRRLLDDNYNIDITIAGDGTDKDFLTKMFSNYENVHFITYKYEDTLKIHADKDIAVVPTVGSEGTSLALIEAMACKCAVICSDVGGMTNVVIDRFNGLIVRAGNADDLYYSLKRLIEDSKLRKVLGENARNCVKSAFSYEVWSEKWIHVIHDVMSDLKTYDDR